MFGSEDVFTEIPNQTSSGQSELVNQEVGELDMSGQ